MKSIPKLKAAALEFAITPQAGGPTVGKTGARVLHVAGPLKSTITLLDDGGKRVCLIATHFNSPKSANVSALFRRTIAEDLDLPVANVLLFVSHNHTDMKVAENQFEAYAAPRRRRKCRRRSCCRSVRNYWINCAATRSSCPRCCNP